MKVSTSTILSLLALLPTTLSKPFRPTAAVHSPFPNYHITNYTTGCSPAGCVYSFHVSYTSEPCTSQMCEPSFATHCQGTDIQNALVPCDNKLVTSNEIPGLSNVTLQIRHQWDQDIMTGNGGVDGRFWAVANHTVLVGVGVGENGPASFEAGVVEIGGIA